MSEHPRLVAARARAEAARARLRGTAFEAKARLSPAAITDRAIASVKDQAMTAAARGVDSAKRRPVLLSVFVGAAALLMTRAPVRKLLSRAVQLRAPKPVTHPVKTRDRGRSS